MTLSSYVTYLIFPGLLEIKTKLYCNQGTLLTSLTSTCPQNSYKFMVTSTIIQHELKKEAKEGEPVPPIPASRGMHTASGAYWNQDKDALWSYKQMGAEGDNKREFDVVLTCAWIKVDP